MKEAKAGLVREANGDYLAIHTSVSEQEILRTAEEIIERKFLREGSIHDPRETKRFLRAKLADSEQEVFGVMFLDNRHRVIAFETLFFGTIDGTSVHPREVVKRVLHHNGAAVLLAHCHPSGVAEPSQADERITQRLKDALALIDVRVLDHIIVAGTDTVSFAEKGLL